MNVQEWAFALSVGLFGCSIGLFLHVQGSTADLIQEVAQEAVAKVAAGEDDERVVLETAAELGASLSKIDNIHVLTCDTESGVATVSVSYRTGGGLFWPQEFSGTASAPCEAG